MVGHTAPNQEVASSILVGVVSFFHIFFRRKFRLHVCVLFGRIHPLICPCTFDICEAMVAISLPLARFNRVRSKNLALAKNKGCSSTRFALSRFSSSFFVSFFLYSLMALSLSLSHTHTHSLSLSLYFACRLHVCLFTLSLSVSICLETRTSDTETQDRQPGRGR